MPKITAHETRIFVIPVLTFAILMIAGMCLYFGGSYVFSCSKDSTPFVCKSGSAMERVPVSMPQSTPQSDFLAAATSYIMFLATNGAWAEACTSIKITINNKPTSLWPISLISLAPTSNIGVPACGPCLVGGRKVCTLGDKKFTSGITQYGYVTGIQTVFDFATDAQAVQTTTVDGVVQVVITANVSNAPLWLNDTQIWWAAPIDTLACDQSLVDGTWVNHWARFGGTATAVAFLCGQVQLTVPVTSARSGDFCSTSIDFTDSQLTFSNITVTVGQIRVAGWLIPAALLVSVRADIAQAIAEQGICNIPKNSLSSFTKVTLPIICPLCTTTPPVPPSPPVPSEYTPVSIAMLDTVLGDVMQAVLNAAIYLLWPADGVKLSLDPTNKTTGAAQLLLSAPPAVTQIKFEQEGNFIVVPTAAAGSASNGCSLQLQFSTQVLVQDMQLDLVVPQRIDSLAAVLAFVMIVPLTGTSTIDKGGAIKLLLSDQARTLTCTGTDVVDVVASSVGGKVLGDLLSTLVAASRDCLAQALTFVAQLAFASAKLPDVTLQMHAAINCPAPPSRDVDSSVASVVYRGW